MQTDRLSLGQWLAVLLVITNALTFGLWRHTSKELTKEVAAHASTVRRFETAQEVANAKAEAIKQTLIEEGKREAKEADASYASLLNKYNASLLRYQASQSRSERSSDYQLPASEGGYGSGQSSFISITLDDAQVCAVNTARLQAVHDWAVRLPKAQ